MYNGITGLSTKQMWRSWEALHSTPVDLSFSYLRSAVEASLDIKKDQVDPNSYIHPVLSNQSLVHCN
jgi:hypothetical protein